MLSSASWNLVGNMAAICCTPVLNIFLNMFFGPAVNAARGVANQVQGAIKAFVSNFQLASFPQITKSYASGDLKRMNTLIIASSKFSYFLFLCLALPLFIEARPILSIWLVKVPEHTDTFMRLVLIIMVLASFQQILHVANLATGKLKKFQAVKGITLMMMLPISYIALRFGAPAESVFIVQIIVTLLALLIQLKMISPMINLSLWDYIKDVFGRGALVTAVSIPLPFFIAKNLPDTIFSLFVVVAVSILSVLVVTYLMGLRKNERAMVDGKLKKILKRG